ncbi:MAG TPA: 16S rRNA (guanine(527)-N(7))-methyltransferase RsmG [Candidatus Avoscillospira stercoripullorum]|uniref:Ribosomal RNA small subunit methyltransferase G n=1 Tax=Candidatus Avoscillospira stercoripullorum TaxID=2840709 RepID=A0A9D1D878_9FIRM|nr:16S rRNA (guanine(527)-N(7))-methyltransferase RsmG [Candidatus Avoscillospira stercoripullorum]
MKHTLMAELPTLGLSLGEDQIDRLCRFGELLLRQNQVMNLTAITEPTAVARLHFLDSLSLLRDEPLAGKTLIDIGCGAGFPGVPLAIAEPSLQVTLLDSLQKRVNWLKTILPELGVDATCVAARAEEYVAEHREAYDVATSRAVARLNILSELCLPYVKVGGKFLALKGAMAQAEADEAKTAIEALGGRLSEIREYPVGEATHRIVVVEKVRPTPKAYPRKFAKIKQQPL